MVPVGLSLGAISQQPTGLMRLFLYCTLATYRPQGAYWAKFDAAWRQPTCLTGHVGLSLGLYVGNLLVLWGLLGRVWGCVLAMSYETFWTEFGHVCWEPKGLIAPVWPSLAVSWQPTQFSRGILSEFGA